MVDTPSNGQSNGTAEDGSMAATLAPPAAAAEGVFDLSQMKKKKKKKPATAATAGGGAPMEGDVGAQGGVMGSDLPAIGDMSLEGGGEEEAIDFPLPDYTAKKRKWRKARVVFDAEDENSSRKAKVVREAQPWDDSERDYTYSELVNRAFNFLHGKASARGGAARGGGKRKIQLALPQVAREGTKKTVFLNFGLICKQIHRQPDHLLQYIATELGTTGNLQDGGRLVIKGRFPGEAILKVIKPYMLEYVVCSSCKSPDTVLMRDANTRLYFVSCESCGAKRSVAPIRQGFMAQTERRKRT